MAVAIPRERAAAKNFWVICAWAVHCYTALGSILGLLAIRYAAAGDVRASFGAMGLATLIDSTDGPMARALRVRELIPSFDGALLDNVVDYLTYVVAPAFLMLTARLLPPGPLGLALACAVVMTSAYGFCRTDAKTDDHYFRGFPSYWNLVAFYLFCLGFSPTTNAIIVALLAVTVMLPVRFVYPNRTPTLRPLTLMLGTLWAAVTFTMIPMLPRHNPLMLYASLTFIAYYLVLSFVLHARTAMAHANYSPQRKPS